MSYRDILTKIDELRLLVGSWQEGHDPAPLDMEMALDRVKSVYEMLRFPDTTAVQESEEVVQQETEQEIEQEIVQEIEQETQQEQDLEEDDIQLELVNIMQISSESDESEQHSRERLHKILSLYEEVSPEDQKEEVAEAAETIEITETIETTESVVTTESTEITETTVEKDEPISIVVESIVAEPTESLKIATFTPLKDLLGLNDRILLSQELFDEDIDALYEALRVLESQPSFDDAIMHIAENYSWSGDNEGAQLLMTLLRNHYQNL